MKQAACGKVACVPGGDRCAPPALAVPQPWAGLRGPWALRPGWVRPLPGQRLKLEKRDNVSWGNLAGVGVKSIATVRTLRLSDPSSMNPSVIITASCMMHSKRKPPKHPHLLLGNH